jgi:hypothetical protein
VSCESNTICAKCEAGTAYPSGVGRRVWRY